MRTRKHLVALMFSILLAVGAFMGVRYFLSLKTLVVSFENISSVSIYKTKDLDDGNAKEPLKKIVDSGQDVTLPRGNYTLQYEASKNYQSGFKQVELVEKNQSINLSPEYSDDYLNEVLDGELGSIKKAIINKYPKVKSLYSIQQGRLYGKGEWYGTALVYKGSFLGADMFKSDTLRIVLKKENNKWVVATNPPDIILTSISYPDIPVDILRNTNSLPSS